MRKFFQVILWPIITVTKDLFVLVYRINISLEHITSFYVNLRYIFVPLYGYNTFVGRFISFIYRIIRIILGIIILVALWIITFLIPLLWLSIPIIIAYKSILAAVLYIFLLILISVLKNINLPVSKVVDVKKQSIINSFRPEIKRYITESHINGNEFIKKIRKNKRFINFLKKNELYNENFINLIEKSIVDIKKEILINDAYELAKSQNSKYVEIEHIIFSYFKEIKDINILLLTYKTDLETIKEATNWIIKGVNKNYQKYIWQEDYKTPLEGGTGKGMIGRVTPVLDSFSDDYTLMAKKGFIKGITQRLYIVDNITKKLSSGQSNVLLVGPSGAGKTTIVKEIAYQIIKGTKYKAINNKRVISLNIGKLLMGTRDIGSVATKMTIALEEIKNSKDIILFIDEIHELFKGENDLLNIVYSILEPYINSSNIQFIGATSNNNYLKYIEPMSSFARLFSIENVDESSKEETIKILEDLSADTERKYQVFITYPAIIECIELTSRLIHKRVFPDKAIAILEGACSKHSKSIINSEIINKEVSIYTKIPLDNLNQDDSEKLKNLDNNMLKEVIGQDSAVKEISNSLIRARMGIRDLDKPIASFLFIGTTGVGKTQTAKALANNYFGSVDNMIRLDMSEYQQMDSINRLLGNPNGNEAGFLTKSLNKNPFSIILLDEIEKANQKVILTFLQVLDEGRLTDNMGNTIDFTNTIIIATTNVGTKSIQKNTKLDKGTEYIQKQALLDVRNFFAPEFLNRFTDLIVFNTLSKEDLTKIIQIELRRVKEMTKEKGIELKLKPELIKEIIKNGYNEEWGARPLSREIEEVVETYIAKLILNKMVKPGDTLELGLEVYSNNIEV